MNRYEIVPSPGRWRGFVILDVHLGAYCTLVDEHSNALPLEWPTRDGAEAWLRGCYRAWGSGVVPAPRGWRPRPEQMSPWA